MAARHVEDDLADVQAGIGADLDTMLVYNLLRTHSHLSPFLDAGLRRQNLTSAQLNTLLALRAAGEAGLLMGQIGQKLVVTKSNVTGLVDRLERQGLASRVPRPDRRATAVRLTEAGTALLERTCAGHAALLAGLTSGLSDQEKRTLVRLLTKLRRELRARPREGV